MKRHILNAKTSLLLMLLMGALQLCVTSCKDDDSDGGVPEITAVRVPDPAKADSTFTKSGPGQLIAIIGKNLGHTLKVYINDQEVYFNSTMNTDHSLIVTVPSETDGFVLTAFDSSLKDEIRVETTHGTATYAFKVTAPYPQISRIQATYPRKTGDNLNVYGLNLVDIEQVYFTDLSPEEIAASGSSTIGGNHVAATSVETVTSDHHLNQKTNAYETTSVLGVVIPDLPYDSGTMVVECAGGTSYITFAKIPPVPTVLSVDSDMPVPGQTVTIRGREFVQVESVKFGDVTLTADDFTVAETEDEITFVMGTKPAVGGDGLLTVTTPGGSASVLFYNYDCLLTSFDGVDATDNGWGPNASYQTTATANGVTITADETFARIFVETEYQQWWGTMVYFRKDWNGNSFPLPGFDVIPADATADEVYFAIEVFNNGSDYNNGTFTGYIRYMFQPLGDAENQYDNGFEWDDYDAQTYIFARPVLADINNEAPTGRWYRHVLPLSSFACYAGKTYAEIVATGLNQFRLQSINQGTLSGHIDVSFDNARIFYQKK